MPAEHADSGLTFRHLLTHTSGLPHGGSPASAPLWKGGKLNLQFRPGSSYSYSTGAFGILAGLLEEISGQRFSDLRTEYTAKSAGAKSFTIERAEFAGAGTYSDIEDMAVFTIGVMQNAYVPATCSMTRFCTLPTSVEAPGWVGR